MEAKEKRPTWEQGGNSIERQVKDKSYSHNNQKSRELFTNVMSISQILDLPQFSHLFNRKQK